MGSSDEDYRSAGAEVAPTAELVFSGCDMVVKVKEPQLAECAMLRPGQVLFTYLHLAADLAQTQALMKSNAIAIAYETVTARDGSLPLLVPMSEVAGRMSVQVGAYYLQKAQGGRGVLLGGVAGVPRGKVVVIGGGVAGTSAVEMAHGLRADVTVIDRSLPRLRALDVQFHGAVNTIFSTAESIERAVSEADLVIGAVLVPGAAAPKLVTEAMIKRMRAGHGGRGHRDRSGRVLCHQPPDHARRSGLRAARGHALLRHQHARRRGTQLRAGAEQRDASLREGAGR